MPIQDHANLGTGVKISFFFLHYSYCGHLCTFVFRSAFHGYEAPLIILPNSSTYPSAVGVSAALVSISSVRFFGQHR